MLMITMWAYRLTWRVLCRIAVMAARVADWYLTEVADIVRSFWMWLRAEKLRHAGDHAELVGWVKAAHEVTLERTR
jgi:hypothetical protein